MPIGGHGGTLMSTLSSTCPSLSVYLRAWDDIPFFPADLISFPDGDSLLEKLYITELTVEGGETQTTFSFALAWETGEEFSIELPGTSGISLVFGAGGATELKLAFVFAANAFELSIEGGVTLRFDSELIRPVDEESREVVEGSAYEVYLSGIITADAEGNIKIAGADSIAFAPFAIGDTGVIVEPGAVALCLSSETAALLAAEHTDAGLSSTFRGVFIPEGSVIFPDDFPVESITIENAFIGNGGFTGSVETTVETSGSLLGFSFTLTSFTLSFIRNAISSCEGKGSLTIPFFDCEVDSTFSISSGGEMLVALDGGDADGIVSKQVEPIGTLSLTVLEFMSASEVAYIQLSGWLAFEIEGLESLDLPVVAVDGLRIGSDGQVSIVGDGLTLQQQQALNFYGFELVLTSINLGREPDDDRNWIAFSGGIKLTEGLPAGVSTKGLRLLWRRGGTDVELECEGVSVAFEIPEVLSFAGAISLT